MRPREGLRPTSPQLAAGTRIEPPPSDASEIGVTRVATATAEPPLEPPGVRVGSQGLRVTPCKDDSVAKHQPFSGDVDLPNNTAPAFLSRVTIAASAGPSISFRYGSEFVNGCPSQLVASSLTSQGTPASGPIGSFGSAAVLRPAAKASCARKLRSSSIRALRLIASSSTSVAVSSPVLTSAASAVASSSSYSLILMRDPSQSRVRLLRH